MGFFDQGPGYDPITGGPMDGYGYPYNRLPDYDPITGHQSANILADQPIDNTLVPDETKRPGPAYGRMQPSSYGLMYPPENPDFDPISGQPLTGGNRMSFNNAMASGAGADAIKGLMNGPAYGRIEPGSYGRIVPPGNSTQQPQQYDPITGGPPGRGIEPDAGAAGGGRIPIPRNSPMDQRSLDDIMLRNSQNPQPMSILPQTGATQAPIPPISSAGQQQGFTTSAAGNPLFNAFGLSPQQQDGSDRQRRQQFMSSLAAGLKSVGDNWNKPGLAAFSGSMGSGLEGGIGERHKQFTQATQALDRAMKYKQIGDVDNYRKALGEYHNKMAAARMEAAKKGSSAWQITNPGKYNLAERDINSQMIAERQILRETLRTADDPQKKTAIEAYRQKEDAVRKSTYGRYGLDPAQGTPQSPHRPSTLADLHNNVPVGQYYALPKDEEYKGKKYKAGTIFRLLPPETKGAVTDPMSGLPEMTNPVETGLTDQ